MISENKDSMRTGGITICGAFFCFAFGVSNSSIESEKGNPASKTKLCRCDLGREICVHPHEMTAKASSLSAT